MPEDNLSRRDSDGEELALTALGLDTLCKEYPVSTPVDAAAVRVEMRDSRVLVVLDDDPTGTQSVWGLPVLTEWTVESLTWALQQDVSAVYLMTNSRSLSPAEAARINAEVVDASLRAAHATDRVVDFVSRSDSTLRGHFPLEPQVLVEHMRRHDGRTVDGVLVVPAFPDAGRVTIGGTHYAGSPEGGYVPVGETEFARDATFGFASSRLAEWVEERTGGDVAAGDVLAVSLRDLRTNLDTVVDTLRRARAAQTIVIDIVDEWDLRRLALAVHKAEQAGRRFVFRVGPPFVRALIGQETHPPLERADIEAILRGGPAEHAVGGLVVVGSHVSLTTQQLEVLRERQHPVELEIDVQRVLDGTAPHAGDLVDHASAALANGNVVVRTSRALVTGDSPRESLAIARAVSSALVDLVREIVAARKPRFVVAKGGITSSDVGSRGLQITKAFVRGPLLPGIVSLWEPVEGPARGIPYVVFAGNVGQRTSLAEVVSKLSR